LNKKFNYYKHRISYLTGTYNFEMEEFFSSFCVARVCQHHLGFLVLLLRDYLQLWLVTS